MTDPRDLFQVQVEQEARKMAEVMLKDPAMLRAVLDEQNRLLVTTQKKLTAVEAERDDLLREIQEQFKGAKHLDAQYIAGKLGLKYVDPKGKRRQITNAYFLQILEHDGILERRVDGYAMRADWYREEKASRFPNGRGYYRVLFTQKGFESLYRKYRKDTRVWVSDGHRIHEATV